MRFPCGTAPAFAVAVLLALLAQAAAGATPTGLPDGYVQISSDPPGATVFVNQVRMDGVTPLTVRVPAGQQQEVVVNLYGYETGRETVMLQPDQTLPLHFELRLLPGGAGAVTETPGAAGTPAAPGGTAGPGATVTREIWEEETPLPASLALLALAGAGLLARRRR